MARTARTTERSTGVEKETASNSRAAKRQPATATTRKKEVKKKIVKKQGESVTPRKRGTVKQRAAAKDGAEASTRRTKRKPQVKTTGASRSTRLEADLKKYSSEEFTQPELIAGVQLAVQVAGIEALGPTLLALITEWVPGLDERMEKDATQTLKAAIKKKYATCTVEQRKALRALLHWIGNDFSLQSNPATSQFTSGFSSTAGVATQTNTSDLRPFDERRSTVN